MKRPFKTGIASLLITLLAVSSSGQSHEPRVIDVRMMDKSSNEWVFEPADITVMPGDTIRWIQQDLVPHNVQFKDVPKGATLDDIMFGPFLVAKGDVYEITIDDRFSPGKYEYVCTPHLPMGMKGSITVMDHDMGSH